MCRIATAPAGAAYLTALLLGLLQGSATAADEPGSESAGAIMVTGEDGKPQRFDADALSKLPQRVVQAEAHGLRAQCNGPALIDVLAKVGAPAGEALRGKSMAMYVRVSAADGYRAVFALAELDRSMRDDVPIVTASCDGRPLAAKDGPFRIVAPGERRPARWVRQVTAIDLLRAP